MRFFFAFFKLTKIQIAIFSSFTMFFFAPFNKENFYLFFSLFLFIQAALSLNSIQEIKIDTLMKRTQSRPLVTKEIDLNTAYIITFFLFFISSFLALYKGYIIPLLVMITGAFLYNILYTPLKIKYISGYIFGFLSGAIPPFTGLISSKEEFKLSLILFFLFFILWQIQHTLVLQRINLEDLKRANIYFFPLIESNFALKKFLFFLSAIVSIFSSIYFFNIWHPYFILINFLYFIFSLYFILKNLYNYLLKTLNIFLFSLCLLSIFCNSL